MADWIEKALTLYGPMAGGWVIAYLLWQRLKTLEDRLNDLLHESTELAQNNTKTLLVILERLDHVPRRNVQRAAELRKGA